MSMDIDDGKYMSAEGNKNKGIGKSSGTFGLIFTVSVFVILASLDNAVIGMFPPLFSSIAHDLDIHVSNLGVVSAVNIFVISFSSILWAYLSDKGDRKRLILAGTLIWSLSVFMTSLAKTYWQLLIYQLMTGIGLGCISSIGFSILADSVPKKWRGTVMSLWSMSQGFGIIAGSLMASMIAPVTSWREPFKIISILGSAFMLLYFFIQEPQKGASEPELEKYLDEGFKYEYGIELNQIHGLVKKKSNIWLMLETFFLYISNGTLIWLPTLFISKIEAEGYSQGVAVIAAGYLYAISQAGGIIAVYLGYIGDRLQRKYDNGRALFTAFSLIISAALYIPLFLLPLKNLQIPVDQSPLKILAGILGQMVTNPWMLLFLLLAVGASAANSANNPNWLALLIDVNLPEHRATIFSIANLVTGTGRALGNLLLGTVLGIVSHYYGEPQYFIISLIIFQAFIIPAAAFYFLVSGSCRKDMSDVRATLIQRAKNQSSRNPE